ncbi:hypothetical protein Cni_G21094 [Canna indica]|uniref:Uncharacterized protein n=1 Tax=Canna indica TaxID=4628 RepID=A0AAQ3QK05_9LILI|nr:hypothetical protein Cni_G21094 [Canna indica]
MGSKKNTKSLWSVLASWFRSFKAADRDHGVKPGSAAAAAAPSSAGPDAAMVAAAKHFSNKQEMGSNKHHKSLSTSVLAPWLRCFLPADRAGRVKPMSPAPPAVRPDAGMVAAAKHFSSKVNLG